MSVDLTTRYLGMELKSPLMASACPLTGDLKSLRLLELAGASAVVLPSLFEEQIEHDIEEEQRLHELQSESNAEAQSYFPRLNQYNSGTDEYLQLIEKAKSQLKIPVIASLNGSTDGGWVHYANLMEKAGADAIELNIYFIPTDPNVDASEAESQYVDLVASVRREISLPLAVKIGPYFSSIPHLAGKLIGAGADGLVLFNRYLAPDIDLQSLMFRPDLPWSQPEELRMSLRWISILRGQTTASLAATSGVYKGSDAAKAILVGADAVMMASALLRHGPEYVHQVTKQLSEWMTANEVKSVQQIKGSMSMEHCANPDGLKRANYMKALTSFTITQSIAIQRE